MCNCKKFNILASQKFSLWERIKNLFKPTVSINIEMNKFEVLQMIVALKSSLVQELAKEFEPSQTIRRRNYE